MRTELLRSPVPPLFLGLKNATPKSTKNQTLEPPKPSNTQLANFCPVSFPGIDAERLIYLLEDQGVYVSTGAACAASKGEKSKTLQAIDLSEAEIAGSLRISFGSTNTESDIKKAGQLIVEAVATEYHRISIIPHLS